MVLFFKDFQPVFLSQVTRELNAFREKHMRKVNSGDGDDDDQEDVQHTETGTKQLDNNTGNAVYLNCYFTGVELQLCTGFSSLSAKTFEDLIFNLFLDTQHGT